jgi:deoxyribodipyrimidine photo-lyase
MARDQKAMDNHALTYAQAVAQAHNVPLKVVFNLVPKFLEATIRQYGLMVKGLQETEQVTPLRSATHMPTL